MAAVAPDRPPLFSGISAADYTAISAGARVKEFQRGEMLYVEGDSAQQVLVVTAGFVKTTKLGNSGTEVILRFCGPGDVLGASGLFTALKQTTTAEAFRQCRTLTWGAREFKALVERFPVLHINLVRILTGDLLELEMRFREVATEKVGPRVARQLVRLVRQIGRRVNGEVEICISRQDLGQMTGTTLFTVSRLLSSWEARGMVKSRRETVIVCDVESLRTMSELS